MGLNATWVARGLASLGLALGCSHCDSQKMGHHQPASPLSPMPSEQTTTTTTVASQAPSRIQDLNQSVSSIDAGANPLEYDAGIGICHVLAIGDSLTDPRSNGGGYLKAWQARCPECRFTNIGRGGAMVNQMLSQLRRHLLESENRYSHWVVFGGVNDLYSDLTANRTVSKIERDLETIYELSHKRGSLVVAITVAPWGGFRRWYTEERGLNTKKLNDWIDQAQKMGIVDFVVDSGKVLACGDPMQLCPILMAPYRDGLHFGPEGHRRLGESLMSTLNGAACGSAASR